MKQTWERLTKSAESFKTVFEELLEILPESPSIYKRQRKVEKEWHKLKTEINFMDDFVSPTIVSVKVKSPLLDDAGFLATWKLWKDYLIEQHGIHMRSRAELMSLKRLHDIAKGDPREAIFTLEFAMGSNGMYSNFFPVDKEKAGYQKPDAEKTKNGALKISVPQQYKLPRQTTLDEQIEKEEKIHK